MVGLNVGDSPVKRSVENRRVRENVVGVSAGMRSDVLSGVEVHGAGTIREMRWMVYLDGAGSTLWNARKSGATAVTMKRLVIPIDAGRRGMGS
jgi:hypothetical protein